VKSEPLELRSGEVRIEISKAIGGPLSEWSRFSSGLKWPQAQ